MNLFILLAGDPKSGGGTIQLLFLGLMILVFWLFMIRPQAKKAKLQKSFIDNLQKGEKVSNLKGAEDLNQCCYYLEERPRGTPVSRCRLCQRGEQISPSTEKNRLATRLTLAS